MILVSQSFGRVSEYRRVMLAVLSFYTYTSDSSVTTVLFTDNPDWFSHYFQGINVHYVPLDAPKIAKMRGDIDFLHRMKIALIEEAFQLFNTDILYIDSDTFFTADPIPLMSKLDPQTSFMHLWEYQFETIRNMPLPAGASFQAFVRLIDQQSFSIPSGSIQLSAAMSSWNAGVMMLHQSHTAFLPDVYALTEHFYPDTQNHASEQYAFSIILQSKTKLSACDAVIYHYWYGIKKKIMDEFLEQKSTAIVEQMTLEERLNIIRMWTKRLPSLFDNHLYTLKDNAIQAWNVNNFGKAYNWAFKAIFAGAITDTSFLKDALYHLKRQIMNR